VATVVLAVSLLANTDASPASKSPGAAVGSSARATVSPSADDIFPNAGETALLARIDPAIARLCARAARSDYPPIKAESGSHKQETLPVRLGLRCALGGSQPDVVFLWIVAPTFEGGFATTLTFFFQRVSAAAAPGGDCATDTRAYMSWSFGLLAGKVLCVASPARARLDWIYDGENAIATAERDDGDRAALYQWWLDVGRALLH
jgi:hypothetical protein